jgi:ribA/ribD-fused uncharacterized protein
MATKKEITPVEEVAQATPPTDITEFQGEYRWLSNFWPAKCWYAGVNYGSVEAAYQAAKTEDVEERTRLMSVTPAAAKKIGRSFTIREGWSDMRLAVMKELLSQKFTEDNWAGKQLIATHPAKLSEGNYWGDSFWGIDLKKGKGKNHLGKLLMERRNELRGLKR